MAFTAKSVAMRLLPPPWPPISSVFPLIVSRSNQVKERAPHGSWTAQTLIKEGVLGQFIRQNRIDPDGELVLYTASDASDFREVSRRPPVLVLTGADLFDDGVRNQDCGSQALDQIEPIDAGEQNEW